MQLKRYFKKGSVEAGCDEAGRGCYAGPVFAAAVILPSGFHHPLLNDSKQVKAADRTVLRNYIIAHATAFGVGSVSVPEIDQMNILKASFLAMHRAIDQLKQKPSFLLIDGNRFAAYGTIPHRCFVKGDAHYAAIAAASILAKTYRDEHMMLLHASYPAYDWISNKGYGTKAHREAIALHGLTEHHRRSFNIMPSVQSLF